MSDLNPNSNPTANSNTNVKLPPISFLSNIPPSENHDLKTPFKLPGLSSLEYSNNSNTNTEKSTNMSSTSSATTITATDSNNNNNNTTVKEPVSTNNSVSPQKKFQLPSLSDISNLPSILNKDSKDDLNSYKFPPPQYNNNNTNTHTHIQSNTPHKLNYLDYPNHNISIANLNGNSTVLEPNDTTILQNESTILEPNMSIQQQQQNQQQSILPFENKTIIEEDEEADTKSETQQHINGNGHSNEEEEETVLNEVQTIDENDSKETSISKRRKVSRAFPLTVNDEDVFDIASKFPREELGSILYQEYPTSNTIIRNIKGVNPLETLNIDSPNKINKRIELLPLDLKAKINSLIDIHIPLNVIPNNSNVYNRRVWGTDIYTDDSDIIAILYHCGILKSKDPEDQYESILNNETTNTNHTQSIEPITPGNKDNIHNIHYSNQMDTEKGYDELIVTLIILPTLEEYHGSYRNNYNSRDWVKQRHNGYSIAVYGVQWCKLNQSLNLLSMKCQSVRKRLLDEDSALFAKCVYGNGGNTPNIDNDDKTKTNVTTTETKLSWDSNQ